MNLRYITHQVAGCRLQMSRGGRRSVVGGLFEEADP